MIWFVYNMLFAVGYAIMLPKFLLRMWRRGGYRKDFMHRFAVYSPALRAKLRQMNRPIWIHAVSVGEIQIALRFIGEYRATSGKTRFVLTTTTSTGHNLAEKKMHPDDALLYFPADFPPVCRRALSAISPSALLLTESEIWPNIIRIAKAGGIPVALINGRISESSYKGYTLLKPFFRRVFGFFDLFILQAPVDETRLIAVGADKSRMRILGSAKYDVAVPDPNLETKGRQVLQSSGVAQDDPIFVGGSTWPGEEAALLDIFKSLKPEFPRLRLVLVPRHAERREEVKSVIEAAGVSYSVRASPQGSTVTQGADVLLVATTGELMGFYATATVVFVGKSLTSHGGQNVIEPAMLGKPVLVGPNVENFEAVVADFLAAGAIIQVQNATELSNAVRRLLKSDEERSGLGSHAAGFVRSQQGILKKSVELIHELLTQRHSAGA